ncbi:hypothetical protein J5Y09_05790 [Roseomonas sp. PWR1]|uniref:Uncharacterized protein n=1 Tax=Roseomonas nitratireducens TaxID=2820810 RepID=A0ABS4APY1_9PROT|nr:hypothetical protein [Neoroseomonas nitratireducens]MBP0463415.1 hypothetical protein [Neoroseomonas nitratireducens]
MRRFAALFALPFLAAPALAQPPAAPGVPYAAARQALLAAGWEPLRVPDADRCAPRDARCEGRPEMVACAGTGLAPCAFAWRRGAEEIEVLTTGPDTIVTGTRQRLR